MAKTIHTILYDDTLDGSKIVTMDNCVCQLYDIKRNYDSIRRNGTDYQQNQFSIKKSARSACTGKHNTITDYNSLPALAQAFAGIFLLKNTPPHPYPFFIRFHVYFSIIFYPFTTSLLHVLHIF